MVNTRNYSAVFTSDSNLVYIPSLKLVINRDYRTAMGTADGVDNNRNLINFNHHVTEEQIKIVSEIYKLSYTY